MGKKCKELIPVRTVGRIKFGKGGQGEGGKKAQQGSSGLHWPTVKKGCQLEATMLQRLRTVRTPIGGHWWSKNRGGGGKRA